MYPTNQPHPPHEVLPTMYDLPSKDVAAADLPDEYQPRSLGVEPNSFNP